MGKYKSFVLLGGVLLIILIVLMILSFGRKDKTTITNQISPTPTLIFQKQATGGGFPTLTPDEEKKAKEIGELRLKTPIDSGNFILDFDWKQMEFTVKSKTEKVTKNELESWLIKNNYELIPITEFKFIE